MGVAGCDVEVASRTCAPKFRGCARDSTHATNADSTRPRHKTAKSQDLCYQAKSFLSYLQPAWPLRKGNIWLLVDDLFQFQMWNKDSYGRVVSALCPGSSSSDAHVSLRGPLATFFSQLVATESVVSPAATRMHRGLRGEDVSTVRLAFARRHAAPLRLPGPGFMRGGDPRWLSLRLTVARTSSGTRDRVDARPFNWHTEHLQSPQPIAVTNECCAWRCCDSLMTRSRCMYR